MNRLFATILMTASISAGAVAHGYWTHRFSLENGTPLGLDLLRDIGPLAGDWQATEMLQIDPSQVAEKTQAQARRFENQKEGRHVIVSVTSGFPGVVSVHTPDVCYLGSGYKLRTAVRTLEIKQPNNEIATVYSADFEKPASLGKDLLRVHWCWSADGNWTAPDFARWYYAKSRARVLYKAYIVHPLREEDLQSKDDPYQAIVGQLLEELGKPLKPKS